MIWMAALLGCAPKTMPNMAHQEIPVKVLIAENAWADDGLQVTIDIHTPPNGPAFERVSIQVGAHELPFGFAQPIEGLGYRLEVLLPIEHEAGQLIEGALWLRGVEQAYSFALVSPFYDADIHDAH